MATRGGDEYSYLVQYEDPTDMADRAAVWAELTGRGYVLTSEPHAQVGLGADADLADDDYDCEAEPAVSWRDLADILD